jgi:hypothetical protein
VNPVRRILSVGALFLLGLGLVGPAVVEAESLGPCEKALVACFSAPGHNLPWDIFACLQGYDFCKRFVEPLL